MKITLKDRIRRISRLPIALLMPALIVGFAAVGHAQGIPQILITAERPADCETSVDLRDQIQTSARRAVWKTQVRVGADLSMKLNNRNAWVQLAGTEDRKRG